MLWQVSNNLNNIHFQYFKNPNINFIQNIQKYLFYQSVTKKTKIKNIKYRFKKFLKPYKITKFFKNYNLLKNFTLNYENIKKFNIKKFTKKYGIKWFRITIYLKFLKLSLLKKKYIKKYMILRKKIRYSSKKKKLKFFIKNFKTKRDRYRLKDWRRWRRIFKGKCKYSYSRKNIFKNKLRYLKYNLYNLNKKIFLYVNDRKFYDIPSTQFLQDSSENFIISELKINSLQYYSDLIINQPYEIVEEEFTRKFSSNWRRKRKFLKILNKPKLTRNAKRRIKKKNKKRRVILRVKKKFKILFVKPLKFKIRRIKFRRLKKKYRSAKKNNILFFVRKALFKYNTFFKKKKNLSLHFVKIFLKNKFKVNYQSDRELYTNNFLKILFKKITKKKIYKKLKNNINYKNYLYKKIYKLKKFSLILLMQEAKIRNQNINLKKKSSIKLSKLLKIKKIPRKFLKISPKYRLKVRLELYKNKIIKPYFYQDLISKSWKIREPILREEMRFFLFEKKPFLHIKKKLLHNSSLQYFTTKINNSFLNLKKKNSFSINDYMFLNYESLESYYLKFYVKEFKINPQKSLREKKKKMFFFNFNTEKLSTYREARKTHWKFFNKKTIKCSRYQKFLNFFLKKTNLFFNKIFTYFQFKFKFSYQFWISFNLLYQSFFNLDSNYKKIFQLPIHKLFWRFLKQYSLQGLKSSIKISDWQSKRSRIKRTFWMQQKIKLPKYLRKKNFNIEGITNTIQYDFITNYFIILKSFSKFNHTDFYIFKNKYIKLHGFKYNS